MSWCMESLRCGADIGFYYLLSSSTKASFLSENLVQNFKYLLVGIFFFQFREMTWLSTLENNYLALLSLPMGGCNHMDPAVSNHLSSMVM